MGQQARKQQMPKIKSFTIFSISVIFLLASISSAFAEEKVTLSTYYPAPIAEYCDLEAEKSFIAGEENTTSDPFTNITPFYGDVVILPQNRDVWDGLEGGSVGIGTDTPTAGTKLEVVGGAIKATGGLIIETRTNTPTAPVAGQLWLRTDVEENVGDNLVWLITHNPPYRADYPYSITSDTDYLYIAGMAAASPAGGQEREWRIEKRAKSNGSLVWAKTTNPSSYSDVAYSIISDDNYLYIAGGQGLPGDRKWRVEKRAKSNGALIWVKISDTSCAFCRSITSDNDYLYIVGVGDKSPGNSQWRIEKRLKGNGASIWVKFDNSNNRVLPFSIISDNNYLYIAGRGKTVSGDLCWLIERRAKSTGNLTWVQTSNPSSFSDQPSSIISDSNYLYIAGYVRPLYAGYTNDMQWRVEKRFKSNGTLIWAYTNTPSFSSYGDVARSITLDANYLYIAGRGYEEQWLIEKRAKSNGGLIWAQTSDYSVGVGGPYSITSDTDYLYIVGRDGVGFPYYWRIEKRFKESPYVDIGLRAYNGTEIITIACEPETAVSSALRIGKDSKVYGIVLVEPTDPNASSIRIKTSSGVKALRKF
jgi:hypothetical protein